MNWYTTLGLSTCALIFAWAAITEITKDTPEKAYHRKIKRIFGNHIKQFIETKGWSEETSSKFFGTDIANIKCILNGNLISLEFDELLTMDRIICIYQTYEETPVTLKPSTGDIQI